MTKAALTVAVIMERRVLANKWAAEQWEAIGVVPDRPGEGPRLLREDGAGAQWLHPGCTIALYPDEAENYLLNVTAPEPRVFVMWRRSEEGSGDPRPALVTVSYGEAARSMDSGEQVDGVPMPADLRQWVEAFARSHYRPEVRRKGGNFASTRQERDSR